MSASAAALEQALRRRTVEWCQDLGDGMGRAIEETAPRRNSEIVDSIEVGGAVETGDGAQCSVVVTAEHARYQEEGTGIYGPEGDRIRARPGGVLAFDWPAAGGMVFATSVAGSPATHFFTRALDRFPQIVRDV